MEAKKEVVGFLGPKASYTHQVSGLSTIPEDFLSVNRMRSLRFAAESNCHCNLQTANRIPSRRPSVISRDQSTTSDL